MFIQTIVHCQYISRISQDAISSLDFRETEDISLKLTKIWSLLVGEMAIQFLAPITVNFQLPETPIPGNLMPSSGL